MHREHFILVTYIILTCLILGVCTTSYAQTQTVNESKNIQNAIQYATGMAANTLSSFDGNPKLLNQVTDEYIYYLSSILGLSKDELSSVLIRTPVIIFLTNNGFFLNELVETDEGLKNQWSELHPYGTQYDNIIYNTTLTGDITTYTDGHLELATCAEAVYFEKNMGLNQTDPVNLKFKDAYRSNTFLNKVFQQFQMSNPAPVFDPTLYTTVQEQARSLTQFESDITLYNQSFHNYLESFKVNAVVNSIETEVSRALQHRCYLGPELNYITLPQFDYWALAKGDSCLITLYTQGSTVISLAQNINGLASVRPKDLDLLISPVGATLTFQSGSYRYSVCSHYCLLHHSGCPCLQSCDAIPVDNTVNAVKRYGAYACPFCCNNSTSVPQATEDMLKAEILFRTIISP